MRGKLMVTRSLSWRFSRVQNWSKVKPPSMVLSSGSCADLYSVTTVSCLAYGSFVYTKKTIERKVNGVTCRDVKVSSHDWSLYQSFDVCLGRGLEGLNWSSLRFGFETKLYGSVSRPECLVWTSIWKPKCRSQTVSMLALFSISIGRSLSRRSGLV